MKLVRTEESIEAAIALEALADRLGWLSAGEEAHFSEEELDHISTAVFILENSWTPQVSVEAGSLNGIKGTELEAE